jgi:DNA-binding transcriptional MerR regulator
MEYTINKLAKIAGVSTRTLRWYDECGLLKPRRISSNGYRVYGQSEVNRLQQILFYRELGFELSKIGRILSEKDFDGLAALQSHHTALCVKKEQLNLLIANVEKSIKAMKGEVEMSDYEKFEGFKQKLIEDNEAKYGEEIRAKYGDETVDRSNAKVKGMTKEQYADIEKLSQELGDTLKAAFEQGDPSSALAQKACDLHRQWLCNYWDSYSKEAHIGVTQMYVDDPRFTEYYDKIAPGCATFLRDAVLIYCK